MTVFFFFFFNKTVLISMTAKIVWGFCRKYGFIFITDVLKYKPSRLHEWEAGFEPHLALSLSKGWRKCWGPDDVAVACLYLALRKRSRKKAGRQARSCFWGSLFLCHTLQHTHSWHPTWAGCDLRYSTGCLRSLRLQRNKKRQIRCLSLRFRPSKTL